MQHKLVVASQRVRAKNNIYAFCWNVWCKCLNMGSRLYWSHELKIAPCIGRHHYSQSFLRYEQIYARKWQIQRQSTIVMTHNMTDSTKFTRFCQCYCLQTEPEPKMSIDELMTSYKGKNSPRQYLPKKLKSRDSRPWHVVKLKVSLMTSMTIGPTVSESCGFQSGDCATKLIKSFLIHQDFTVYFDNWFTFIELLIQLKS